MRMTLRLPTVFLALLLAATPVAWGSEAASGILAGQVTAAAQPLPSTVVYAYQLADFELTRATTDGHGRFLFAALPAGLYKIIAFKPGFLPAVIRLARTSRDMNQYLELKLVEEPAPLASSGEDFWAVRSEIPPDVLRDMAVGAAASADLTTNAAMAPGWRGQMVATTGVDQSLAYDSTPVTGGQIDMERSLRKLKLDVEGSYRQLGVGAWTGGPETLGSSQSVSVAVESPATTRIQLSSSSSRLSPTDRTGKLSEIDFEHLRLSWSQEYGEAGRSDVVARYTTESNFYQQGLLPLGWLPENSEAWDLEGRYSTRVGGDMTLAAGLHYRSRNGVSESTPDSLANSVELVEQRLDLYGESGLRVAPQLLIEYGVRSSLTENTTAVAPSAGLVLQLGHDWQAAASASRRIDVEAAAEQRDFLAASFDEWARCDQLEEYCYQISLSRDFGEGESLTVAAIDRRFGEPVRLYFDDDFFRHLENLYFVEGDRLPEIRFVLTRRISPELLARFSSNVGSGGGGTTSPLDQPRSLYENEVSYVVTSVETRFEPTATGLALTFHQLRQQLDPLTPRKAVQRGEVERLQLLLSQDLNALLQLAAHWAVQLNMELSRGDLVRRLDRVDTSELRRRITGGIAVSF